MDIDPRRSLAAGAMWLIIALAVTFSIAASIWVGSIARANVIEQHLRRLALETDQLSSDFGQALASRLGAVRAARILVGDAAPAGQGSGLARVFDELQSAYPNLDWIALADANGVIVSANGSLAQGSRVNSSPWFIAGLQGPWVGMIDPQGVPTKSDAALGDMAAPVRDNAGRIVGVIAAHLRLPRSPTHPLRLTDEIESHGAAQAYAIDGAGVVLIGPDGVGKRWTGVALGKGKPAVDERLGRADVCDPFRAPAERARGAGIARAFERRRRSFVLGMAGSTQRAQGTGISAGGRVGAPHILGLALPRRRDCNAGNHRHAPTHAATEAPDAFGGIGGP